MQPGHQSGWGWWLQLRPSHAKKHVRIAGRSVCLVLAFSAAPWFTRSRAFSTRGKDYVMTFGKHSGVRLEKVPRSYIDWMVREGVYSQRPDLKAALIEMKYLEGQDAPSNEHQVHEDQNQAGSVPTSSEISTMARLSTLETRRAPSHRKPTGQPSDVQSSQLVLGQRSLESFVQTSNKSRPFLLTPDQLPQGSKNRSFGFKVLPLDTRFAPGSVMFSVTVPAVNCTLSLHNHLLSIPEALVYDRSAGKYAVPIEQYAAVVKAVKKECEVREQAGKAKTASELQAVPPNLVKWLQHRHEHAASEEEVVAALASIPTHLSKALLPFQRSGVSFALRQKGRALIGDEMGLGKSIQGIAAASAYRREWPLLIICPSFLQLNWAAELAKWLPPEMDCGLQDSDIHVVESGKATIDGSTAVTIISYDLAAKLQHALQEARFGVVLLDESHYIKNHEAKRTKSVLPIIQGARRAVLLSGTPTLARPAELFTQLCALCPGAFPAKDKHRFELRYCDLKKGRFGMDNSGASNLDELHAVVGRYFMIRRLKSEVASQLPRKRRQHVWVALSIEGRRELQAAMDEYKSKRAGREGESLGWVAEAEGQGSSRRHSERNQERKLLVELHQRTGLAKLGPVIAYVREMLSSGEKILVFAHHTQVLSQLEEAIKADKTGYIRIDGSVQHQTRQDYVTAFQSDDNIRVALLSITAAGVGLTLTAASNVVFAELHWTPGTLQQAEDRVHRIGQLNPVNIHYLLARGSIDDIIWPSVVRKLRVVGQLLDGHRELADEMTPVSRWADDDSVQQLGKLDPSQRRLPEMQSHLSEEGSARGWQRASLRQSEGGASTEDVWGGRSEGGLSAASRMAEASQAGVETKGSALGGSRGASCAGTGHSLLGGAESLLGNDGEGATRLGEAGCSAEVGGEGDVASELGGSAASSVGGDGGSWRPKARKRTKPKAQFGAKTSRRGAEGSRLDKRQLHVSEATFHKASELVEAGPKGGGGFAEGGARGETTAGGGGGGRGEEWESRLGEEGAVSVPGEDLLCPISLTTMVDPVTAMDGHTYERRNIAEWLATHNTSPMTNEVLPVKTLIPNHRMRAIISSALDKRRRPQ